jgi:hypothetical protein
MSDLQDIIRFLLEDQDSQYNMLILRGRIQGFGVVENGVLRWIEKWDREEVFDEVRTNVPDLVRPLVDSSVKVKPTRRLFVPAGSVRLCSAIVVAENASTQESFIELPDGSVVIGHMGQHFYYATLDDYVAEEFPGKQVRFSVGDDVPDAVRSKIRTIVPDLISQSDAQEATRNMWAMIDGKLKAHLEKVRGGQKLDTEVPDAMPDPVNSENTRLVGPNGRRVVRLFSRGYTGLVERDFEDLIKEHGGEVIYRAPAIDSGYVGTMAGEIEEIKFRIKGRELYAYVLLFTDVDSYAEEVWTTDRRLSASAAANTLMAVREFLQ